MKKGQLYIIATPIGNLEDITYRAIKILKEVDLLLCEDTRETQKLLNFYQIKSKLRSNNEINEEKNVEKVVKQLKEGKKIGLVSDRGTPLISDPGYKIVAKAIEEEYEVISIPGASALITAVPLTGFPMNSFLFVGFLDKKKNKRKKQLEKLKNQENPVIFYESPQRIEDLLREILKTVGDRKIIISREITKKFETHYRGLVSEVISQIKGIKGEIVVIIEGKPEKNPINDKKLKKMVQKDIKKGKKSSEAIKKVAKEQKIKKNRIYKLFHDK